MSAVLEINDAELDTALARMDGMANAPLDELAEGIGRLVQEQTRYRIETEKTAPSGEAWKANRAGSSILYASGTLSQSIDYVASRESIIIGSGLIYARIHQQGGKIIPVAKQALMFMVGNAMVMVKSVTMPARAYLGISSGNRADILDAARDWLVELVQ